MLNLTELDTVQVMDILEANGYSVGDILDSSFQNVNLREQAIYKIVFLDSVVDEDVVSTGSVFFHYMSNGTIWAEF